MVKIVTGGNTKVVERAAENVLRRNLDPERQLIDNTPRMIIEDGSGEEPSGLGAKFGLVPETPEIALREKIEAARSPQNGVLDQPIMPIPDHITEEQERIQATSVKDIPAKEEPEKTVPLTSVWLNSAAPKKIDNNWTRIDLPSRFAPYDFDDCFVRPFMLVHLVRLRNIKNNFSQLVDVVDSVISCNARDLTVSDFYHVLYWLRLNSYTRSPYIITWTSYWGNENQTKVTTSTLKVVELEMTREELKSWREKGIRIPTVRDMEIQQLNSDIDKETAELLQYAQYLVSEPRTDWLKKLIDKVNSAPMSLWEDIMDFSGKVEHGVVNSVELVDEHYTHEAALATLKERKDSMLSFLALSEEEFKKSQEDDSEKATSALAVTQVMRELEKITEEMKVIEDRKANGILTPDAEAVTLSINVTDFFPTVFTGSGA